MSKIGMRPAAEALAQLSGVVGVFSDIDDTISTNGKLTGEAYDALWRLKRAGLRVVPVTGRPAGWCDMIARFWPVDAVIGENGGLYFHHDGARLHRRYMHDEATRRGFREKLAAIRDEILREVPGTAVASDQPYREYDIAIDFCEDVPPLPQSEVVRVQRIFERHGAHAKISSIHVNGWFGDFDKLSTAKLMARELWGEDLEASSSRWIFCGDSPNDEPMFSFFKNSFGMANLLRFESLLKHKPAFLAEGTGGAGFSEIAQLLIASRG